MAPIPAENSLDWSTEFSEHEWDRLTEYYGLGYSNDLFRFAPLMYNMRPDALKRSRLHVTAVTLGVGLDDPLPGSPWIQLIMLPFYASIGYHQGLLAETIMCRKCGATRAQVADTFALAWIHAGPFGMNQTATAVLDYMRSWDPAADGPGIQWPPGWAVDRDAFLSAVDFTPKRGEAPLSDGELSQIEDWHRRVQGSVPAYLPFLAEHFPLALLAFRARYENALQSSSLPPQHVALTQVYLAGMWMRGDALRRAMHMARYFNVAKDHVVQVLALIQIYRGDIGMDGALEGAGEFLDHWPAPELHGDASGH